MKTIGDMYWLLIFALFVSIVGAFGGSEDKFIKKYAMQKIYESCFGPEVIKQIRKEMTAACMKCANSQDSEIIIPMTPTSTGSNKNQQQQMRPQQQPPQQQQQSATAHVASQRPGDIALPVAGPPSSLNSGEGNTKHETVDVQENLVHQPSFDTEKLHQAILAYRPNPFQPQPQFRPYPGGAQPFYAFTNPGSPAAVPIFYPGSPAAFPGPFTAYSQYPNTFYPHQFYSHGQRMSREMNIKDQIDALTNRFSGGRVRNITCVMQELGYLDDNLEPNYNKIIERISNLPVQEELKHDMQEGVTFCQQFSQCVPEIKKENSPLSRDFIKPMFFFKCYKHKKLEACIMKDVRERFNQYSETDFETLADSIRSDDSRQFRSSKAMKFTNNNEHEQLALDMYDYLYGENNDFDSL